MISGAEVVLPDVGAVLGGRGLAGHARAHDLGEAVDVQGVEVEGLLDLAAHLLGPRLGAEDRDLEGGLAGVQAELLEAVRDGQQVGGRGEDGARLEVGDQLHLLLRLPAGHRDHGRPDALGAVVGAEAAGEQAVAVRVVHAVTGADAAGAEAAGDEGGPRGQVVVGVADHGGLAGGAGGGVDAAQLGARGGERAERVALPQELLVRVRELGEVPELREVRGVDAVRVEVLPIRGHVLVGVVQGPAEAFELERLDLVPAHRLLGVRGPAVGGGGQGCRRVRVGDRGLEHGVLLGMRGRAAVDDGGAPAGAPAGQRPGAGMVRERPRKAATGVPSSVVTVMS